jgi:hypothetical protein
LIASKASGRPACIPLGNRDDAGPEATYALLGVPLSRLPHVHLLVDVVDSVVPPVPVLVL